MSDVKPTEYLHGEAFMLMWYECECGHAERIWNSRDGVTPFGLGCPSCGKNTLLHKRWKADVRAPDHKLQRHQHFWRDGTIAEARAIMQRRIDASKGTAYECSEESAQELLSDRVLTDSEFRSGWPMLDVSP